MERATLHFLVFCSCSLSAQPIEYLAILNDPDVIWAAEITPEFAIDQNLEWGKLGLDSAVLNDAVPLKLQIDDYPKGMPDPDKLFLREKLHDLVFESDVQSFDSFGEKPMFLDAKGRLEACNLSDTMVNFDPVTFEPYITSVTYPLDGRWLNSVKLHQLLFYRASTDEFELYTLAFTPIFSLKYKQEDRVYLCRDFWFKMPPYSKKEHVKRTDLNHPNIKWAYRMKTEANSPCFDSLILLKNRTTGVVSRMLTRFATDKKYEVCFGNWDPIPFEQHAGMLIAHDTAVVFDPISDEGKIAVIVTETKPADLTHLKLLEDWFWDEQSRRLIVRLHAFAPVRIARTEQGYFRYRAPFFWKMKK